MSAEQVPVALHQHDHAICITDALAKAEDRCAREGLRLTKARRRVLEILLEAHRALGAYDVLERMRAEGLGAQPPAAYRALDFLVEHGFVHRVEGINAFVACSRPGEDHVPAFLHCRSCGAVAEAVAGGTTARDFGQLDEVARACGFEIERRTIEATGICADCAGQTAG